MSAGLPIELNWTAYFDRFVQVHGEPVLYDRRFLFADGWRYASDNHAGPEYPPPEDPKRLARLQVIYWTIMQKKHTDDILFLSRQIDALEAFQEAKDQPLQQTAAVFDPDLGKTVRGVKDLDLQAMREVLEELEAKNSRCNDELRRLKRVIRQ